MAQFEDEGGLAGGGEMKTGKAAIAERKKKRREGQVGSGVQPIGCVHSQEVDE